MAPSVASVIVFPCTVEFVQASEIPVSFTGQSKRNEKHGAQKSTYHQPYKLTTSSVPNPNSA
jgi:hypothetical protein